MGIATEKLSMEQRKQMLWTDERKLEIFWSETSYICMSKEKMHPDCIIQTGSMVVVP